MPVSVISGLAEIAAAYDLFVVDQWGVLHDGQHAPPSAIDALAQLKNAGKTVVLLSNSGKPAAQSHERLKQLGIGPDLYDGVVTSGEDVRRHLDRRPDRFYQTLGSRFFIFAWDADRSLVEGLDYQEVDDPADADFIIAAGTEHPTIDPYRPAIDAAMKCNLPMICANPDLVTVAPTGELKICPGLIAQTYEEMGGTVRWHGKPTRDVYELCFAISGPFARGLGIGDSLLHDIRGAQQSGLDSLFVTGGIHGEHFNGAPQPEIVAAVANEYDTQPTYAIPEFVW